MSAGIELVSAAAGSRYLSELVKAIFRAPFKTTFITKSDPELLLALSNVRQEISDLHAQEVEFESDKSADRDRHDHMIARRDFNILQMKTKSARSQPNQLVGTAVASHFKLVFLSVLALTVLSIVAAGAISFFNPNLNSNEQKVFDTLMWAFTAGSGAVLGLLGGKSIH